MLVETIDELFKLANAKCYSSEDINLIRNAYIIALEYSRNKFRYRLKTRPFISHLVSVCAILMEFNTNIETVVAGLLHSVNNDMKKIYDLNYNVGEIVNNYFDITVGMREKIKYENINIIKSAVIIIQLANSIDMLKSGELPL